MGKDNSNLLGYNVGGARSMITILCDGTVGLVQLSNSVAVTVRVYHGHVWTHEGAIDLYLLTFPSFPPIMSFSFPPHPFFSSLPSFLAPQSTYMYSNHSLTSYRRNRGPVTVTQNFEVPYITVIDRHRPSQYTKFFGCALKILDCILRKFFDCAHLLVRAQQFESTCVFFPV